MAWHAWMQFPSCNNYERKCVIVWNSFILVRQTSQPLSLSLSLSISTLFFMMSIGKYDPSVMLRLHHPRFTANPPGVPPPELSQDGYGSPRQCCIEMNKLYAYLSHPPPEFPSGRSASPRPFSKGASSFHGNRTIECRVSLSQPSPAAFDSICGRIAKIQASSLLGQVTTEGIDRRGVFK